MSTISETVYGLVLNNHAMLQCYYYISTLRITPLLNLQCPDAIQNDLPNTLNLLFLFPALLFTTDLVAVRLYILLIWFCLLSVTVHKNVNSMRIKLFISFVHCGVPCFYNRAWHKNAAQKLFVE